MAGPAKETFLEVVENTSSYSYVKKSVYLDVVTVYIIIHDPVLFTPVTLMFSRCLPPPNLKIDGA
jgi:hypothetical protein